MKLFDPDNIFSIVMGMMMLLLGGVLIFCIFGYMIHNITISPEQRLKEAQIQAEITRLKSQNYCMPQQDFNPSNDKQIIINVRKENKNV